jgi:hypothetical protein
MVQSSLSSSLRCLGQSESDPGKSLFPGFLLQKRKIRKLEMKSKGADFEFLDEVHTINFAVCFRIVKSGTALLSFSMKKSHQISKLTGVVTER